MPKLLKAEHSYYARTEEWLCKMENETGTETEAEIKAQFDIEVAKIRESAPDGSFALMPTKYQGLFVRIKMDGEWLDV